MEGIFDPAGDALGRNLGVLRCGVPVTRPHDKALAGPWVAG